MSRWLGATFGNGISRFSITSGPPVFEIVIACIVGGYDILEGVVENWRARVKSRRVNDSMRLNRFLRVDKGHSSAQVSQPLATSVVR
jgi:hypothetical protein